MTPEKVDKLVFDALVDIASGKYDAATCRDLAKAAAGGFLGETLRTRPRIMSDDEYNKRKTEAMAIIGTMKEFNAWRFKHEARTRGDKQLGLLMWALHLAASDY